MKGYNSLPVGSELVLYQNLIDNNTFSEEDFKIASSDVTKLKNLFHPSKEDFNLRLEPGIQLMQEYMFSEVITKLNLYGMKQVKSIYENEYDREAPLVIAPSWIYYQHKDVKSNFWHVHTEAKVKTYSNGAKHIYTNFPVYKTLVMYFQLPEDVKEAGKIWFSPNRRKFIPGIPNNKISQRDVSFTPKVGDIVIFPGTMPHFPEIHKGDTNRIVLGTNVYIQKPKSLL